VMYVEEWIAHQARILAPFTLVLWMSVECVNMFEREFSFTVVCCLVCNHICAQVFQDMLDMS